MAETTNHETEAPQVAAVAAPVTQFEYRHNHKPFAILMAILAVLVIFLGGLMAGRMVVRHAIGRTVVNSELSQGAGNRNLNVNANRGFGGGMGMMGGHRGFGGVNANSQVLTGVVTAVNGTSFTVAGNGTTETVNTSSSTQYLNGSAVGVNDTVRVIGTASGSVWTATRIVIN